jgi:hypothetical protein
MTTTTVQAQNLQVGMTVVRNGQTETVTSVELEKRRDFVRVCTNRTGVLGRMTSKAVKYEVV